MPVDHRRNLLAIFHAALTAVNGGVVVRERLRNEPFDRPLWLIAIGKAACAMAQGAHEARGENIADALIVTKEGHAETLPWPVLETGHPLPDERSLAAGEALLGFAAKIPPTDSVLMLLSGGASALCEVLPEGVTLSGLRDINRWLLGSGLDIAAMNRIRKRLSRLKGGRLARLLAPRAVLCLAISDVPGDDPRAIGSGPLSPDPDALRASDLAGMPAHIGALLHHATAAPPPGDECFNHIRFEIVARLDDARRAACDAARAAGYRAQLRREFLDGETLATGAHLARELEHAPAGELQVWGGETTLVLPVQTGRGGRNQSLALSAAIALQGQRNAWLLAAGTDGTDGPTTDAGALVDGETVLRGESAGLSAHTALANADAGTFLEASGDLLQTGPTGTNVMDLVLGLRV